MRWAEFEVDLRLRRGKRTILDLTAARLLWAILEHGSILSAARALGIPYSTAWSIIRNIEESSGTRIVVSKRGGSLRGSTRLSMDGIRLLRTYISGLSSLGLSIDAPTLPAKRAELSITGSDDTLMRELLDDFSRETGIDVSYNPTGSIIGVLNVALGRADVGLSHAYDWCTGGYNVPYVRRLGFGSRLYVIRGYTRRLVLGVREPKTGSLRDILANVEILATRGPGSGTLIYLMGVLERLNFAPKLIYCGTHREAARLTANGSVDACVVIEYEAIRHGLNYVPIGREYFDVIIPIVSIGLEETKTFLRYLKRRESHIARKPGYGVPKSFLSTIWTPG